MTDTLPPIRRKNPRSRYPWLDYAEQAAARPGRVIKVAEDIPRSSIVSARGVIALRNRADAHGRVRVTQRDGHPDPDAGWAADVYFTYETEG